MRKEMSMDRNKTLTVKMTAEELARARAMAEAGDESVGRLIRGMVNSAYQARFGNVAPPEHEARIGRPKGKKK